MGLVAVECVWIFLSWNFCSLWGSWKRNKIISIASWWETLVMFMTWSLNALPCIVRKHKKTFSFKTRSRDPTSFIYFYRLKRKFLHRLPNQTDCSLIFMSQALPPVLVSNHALEVQRIKGVCKARQLPKHTHTHTHTHSFTFWIELAQLVTPVSYCIYVDCVLVALLVWCLFTRLSYFQTFRCMT